MEANNYKILIVDDEPDIVEMIRYNIKKEGFTYDVASNGLEAITVAEKFLPDLILLDVMMPEMDGIEVCKELRSKAAFKDTIIAFLTARNEDYTEIAGFESGGDDFINKPIKPRVLISRIKALLKRKGVNNDENEVLVFGDITINTDEVTVYKKEKALNLTKREFDLLFLLCTKPEKVFKREEIFRKIWGNDLIVGDRTIDVHIRKIREKLGDKYIKTMKGVGYRFTF